MRDVHTRRRQQYQIIRSEDIQFGYHSVTGKFTKLTNDGIRAERIDPDRVLDNGEAYGARPLKGNAEFEVKIVSYGAGWHSSIGFGVMRFTKGVPIDFGCTIPSYSKRCVWAGKQLCNYLTTPTKRCDYGSVDLDDLREEDHLGLRLSEDGVLEFTVNGESQGTAAEKVYTRDGDIYAVVHHDGECVATEITKAGEQILYYCYQQVCKMSQ